jgi:hypothetical protein
MTPRNPASPKPIVSVSCWFDLYRYGSSLNEASFDPSHALAALPIARLSAFQKIVRAHSEGGFPTLVLNDGAVAYADVGSVRRDKLWKFIERCAALFDAATLADRNSDGHGLRAVIALGLRRRGRADGIRAQETAHFEIIDDLVAGRIDGVEAKERARRVRRVFDIVPQLQANFAFTRAYLAETSGSKGGFDPGNLYLDARAFRGDIPAWFGAGQPVSWVPKRKWLATLATSFVPISLRAARDEQARMALRTGSELLEILRCREN